MHRIVGLLALLALVCLAASAAHAGTVTLVYDAPLDPDLAECTLFLRQADGTPVDVEIVPAAQLGAGRTVVFDFATVPLQGQNGEVSGTCEDVGGQTSAEAPPRPVTFPDVEPGAPVLRDVQVAP